MAGSGSKKTGAVIRARDGGGFDQEVRMEGQLPLGWRVAWKCGRPFTGDSRPKRLEGWSAFAEVGPSEARGLKLMSQERRTHFPLWNLDILSRLRGPLFPRAVLGSATQFPTASVMPWNRGPATVEACFSATNNLSRGHRLTAMFLNQATLVWSCQAYDILISSRSKASLFAFPKSVAILIYLFSHMNFNVCVSHDSPKYPLRCLFIF